MPLVSTPHLRKRSISHAPTSLPTTPRTPTREPSFARPHAVIAAPPPISRHISEATDSSPGSGQYANPVMMRSINRSPATITSSFLACFSGRRPTLLTGAEVARYFRQRRGVNRFLAGSTAVFGTATLLPFVAVFALCVFPAFVRLFSGLAQLVCRLFGQLLGFLSCPVRGVAGLAGCGVVVLSDSSIGIVAQRRFYRLLLLDDY